MFKDLSFSCINKDKSISSLYEYNEKGNIIPLNSINSYKEKLTEIEEFFKF